MKKSIVLLVFIALFTFSVGQVLAEEVVPSAPGVTASEMNAAIGGVSKKVNNLRGELLGKKGILKELEKSSKENTAAITKLANETGKLATSASEIAKESGKTSSDVVTVGKQVHKAHEALLQVNENFLERFRVFDAKAELNFWYLVGLVVLFVAAIIFAIAYATKGGIIRVVTQLNTIERKIDEVPENTNTRVKTLDRLVIDNLNVDGHDIVFVPPIVDGMYVTLYVPSTVTSPVANPSQIARVRMTDKAAVRRSTRKAMAAYFAAKAPGAAAPVTEQGKQQIALIDFLSTTAELHIG